MAEPSLTIRPPQQKRSRASFERVLKAARELLQEEGYPSFTLARVSERSGVSIGSIYARVESKDALFHAVHERVMEEISAYYAEGERECREDLPTRELLLDAIRIHAEPFRRYADFLRVVMHVAPMDEVVASYGSKVSSEQAEHFAALVLRRRDEIVHPDPELAVDVAYRMVYCTLARQVMYGPTFESQRAVGWDELVHELGQAVVAYLLGPRA